MGSSGYGSHGSNGSHEQLVSISSSSESNGNVVAENTAEEQGKAKPTRTFQEICKGVHMLKNQDSQVGLRSPSPSPSPSSFKPEQKKISDGQSSRTNIHFLLTYLLAYIFLLLDFFILSYTYAQCKLICSISQL